MIRVTPILLAFLTAISMASPSSQPSTAEDGGIDGTVIPPSAFVDNFESPDEEDVEPSADYLLLEEYVIDMLEYHPIADENKKAQIAELVCKSIPKDLDIREYFHTSNTVMIVGIKCTCPRCFNNSVEITITRSGVAETGEIYPYNDPSSYWYPDEGDTAIGICEECDTSFSLLDYCKHCMSVGNIQLACVGTDDVYGICSNCSAITSYHRCRHNCSDNCSYRRYTEKELEDISYDYFLKIRKLQLLWGMFDPKYF